MTDQTQTQETQEENQAPQPGTPEHDLAMVNKGREAKGLEPLTSLDRGQQTSDEGEGEQESTLEIPDKFRNEDGTLNQEALLKSYRELESGKGQQTQEQQETQSQATSDETGESLAEKAGVSYADMKAKVEANGDIEDADYEAFEKAGIPKDMVKDFIDFRKTELERNTQRAFEYMGGEDKAQEILSWAADNLTPEEVETYNKMLSGQNWKSAIDRLQTMKGAASRTAKEPRLTQPGATTANGADAFQSKEEMRHAMKDPKYFENSPDGAKYRAEVARKTDLMRKARR